MSHIPHAYPPQPGPSLAHSQLSPDIPRELADESQSPPKRGIDDQLTQMWERMTTTSDAGQFCGLIKEYCLVMVNSRDEDVFTQYFVESKFLGMLMGKVREHRQTGELPRTIFSLFEFLLKALKQDEQLVYFLLRVSHEGFISEEYVFKEEEDEAYYANFLKLMVRKINEDGKYLTVFLNSREPHFPLLLQLLRMHGSHDAIMLTSSKLAILEISNNPAPLVQAYMNNFPFVLFYPLELASLAHSLRQAVLHDSPSAPDSLESNLKYMEDFVENKEKTVVNMYTNSFLKTVGNYLFDQLDDLQEKNIQRTIRLMKVLLHYVIPEVGVLKIRIGLLCLFAPLISPKMRRCFEAKTQPLESKFWIPECCPEEVARHCKAIFYKEDPPNKSLLQSFNSYIPRSRDNWLYHQLRKASDNIGFEIVLGEPIRTDNCLPESFLDALWTMIDDQLVRNQILTAILKMKNEEIVYYYLRVLAALCQAQEAASLIEFSQLVPVLQGCTSVSLLQAFHNLVVRSRIRERDSAYMNRVYSKVTEKLIHFVLTKGWNQLLLRAKESRLAHYDEAFSADIYREIECEILLFVSLRTLLGTGNEECAPFSVERWLTHPPQVIETIFKSHDSSESGPLVYTSLDGQFLNLKSCQEMLINKEELLVTDLKIYEEGKMLNVYGSPQKGSFFTSLYLQPELRQYLLKEVASRRQMANRISLELKSLRFQFDHK